MEDGRGADQFEAIVTIRVKTTQPAAIVAHARRYVAEYGLTDEHGQPLVFADDDYKTALLYLFDHPDNVDVGTVTSVEIVQTP